MADQAPDAFQNAPAPAPALEPSTPPVTPEPDPAPQSTGTEFFDSLVGDGRKFDGKEALAKGKIESDQFIDQLQSELKGLRTELDTRATAEETVEKLLKEREPTPANEGVTTPSPQPMSEKDIAELVKQTIETTRTAETEQSNIAKADKVMEVKFGEKRAEWLAGEATKLGVTVAFLQNIAAASPDLFLKTVGLDEKAPAPQGATSGGSVNTEALITNPHSSGPTEGTFKWYEAQRKENPRAFWKPEVQNRLMKHRTEMGEDAFYA